MLVCLDAAVMKALGRYGKLLEDGTRKAADATGNIWHHRPFTFLLCSSSDRFVTHAH